MSRRRTPAAAETRARELAKGRTVRGVADQLKREGFKVGKSTVASWLASAAPKAAPSTAGQGQVAPRTKAAATPSPKPPSEGDAVSLLNEAAADLRELCALAKTDGRLPEFSTLQRTLNQTVALAARLTPAPPPDIEQSLDMRAAATSARAKLLELVRRSRQASAAAGNCPTCGAHQQKGARP